jgi:hypothetical protein
MTKTNHFIFCAVIVSALVCPSYAFEVDYVEPGNSGMQHHFLHCADGTRFIITWDPDSDQFYGLNDKLYLTLSEAAISKGCQ